MGKLESGSLFVRNRTEGVGCFDGRGFAFRRHLMHCLHMGKLLDHHLDCKTCGTIRLEIPDDADWQTAIHCSTCHGYLGTWGDLKEDFRQQARPGPGVFDLHDGQFEKN